MTKMMSKKSTIWSLLRIYGNNEEFFSGPGPSFAYRLNAAA